MAATIHPRTVRRGRAVTSAPSFGTRLAVDADIGPRDRLEPLDRDLAARIRADAVRALLQPCQRGVDLVDHMTGLRREQEVTFALDVHGVAFARLFVELGVATLALPGELLGLGDELLGLVLQARLLLEELLLEAFLRLRREAGRARLDLEARQ